VTEANSESSSNRGIRQRGAVKVVTQEGGVQRSEWKTWDYGVFVLSGDCSFPCVQFGQSAPTESVGLVLEDKGSLVVVLLLRQLYGSVAYMAMVYIKQTTDTGERRCARDERKRCTYIVRALPSSKHCPSKPGEKAVQNPEKKDLV
jgi:hypothetical protein